MVKGMKQYPISDLSSTSLAILKSGGFFLKFEDEDIDIAILSHEKDCFLTIMAAIDNVNETEKNKQGTLFEILDNNLKVVYTGRSDNPYIAIRPKKENSKPNSFIQWLKS
jgi:hypothetical protein